MPRQSSAALAVVPNVAGQPTRIRPPADMGETEAAIFRGLVASVDASHFRTGDAPLLRQYVEAIALAEKAAEELRRDGAVIDGKTSPWLIVSEKAQRAMVALSARLRLAPQSRFDRKAAGRRGPQASPYDAMMENGDDDP